MPKMPRRDEILEILQSRLETHQADVDETGGVVFQSSLPYPLALASSSKRVTFFNASRSDPTKWGNSGLHTANGSEVPATRFLHHPCWVPHASEFHKSILLTLKGVPAAFTP